MSLKPHIAFPLKKSSSADSLRTISHVLLTSFIIATLYFGRELLVPLALAALLTFLLSPLTSWLQHWMGRVGAVLIVVAMLLAGAGAGGWVLTRQALDLANQLPEYKENIRTKMRSIQLPTGGPFSRVTETVRDLKRELPSSSEEGLNGKTSSAPKGPVRVEVVKETDKPLEFVRVILAPVLGPLGTMALILLLLIFMLMQRDDLRNRLIRLIGQGRIGATTRAMDDAGNRVTRYLLMVLVVNLTYGIPVAVGLYFIGVPNAVLWGSLAIVLRFIPYVGPWIAASFPILLSLAISPDWTTPLLTLSLFVVLELISNNVMEPWLYGSSTGVTPIALIVAALVWTWLWGPLGLVLATPITVCLVVMGRHVPGLAFLSIALSDEEPLTPAEECYHRLHRAGDHDAMELVENYLKINPPGALFDSVLIPVVIAAESDHKLGLLEDEQLERLETALNDVLEELDVREDLLPTDASKPAHLDLRICLIPARAHRDELAGSMLGRLLRSQGCSIRTAPVKLASLKLAEWVREEKPEVICISVVAPTRTVNARYLCTKLRKDFPEVKILVGLWGNSATAAEELKAIRESGADEIVTTVTEASEWVTGHSLIPISAETEG